MTSKTRKLGARRAAAALLATIIASAVPASGTAAPGGLDSTFSGDGKVSTDVTPGGDFAGAAAVQGDGKIVVVGGAAAYNHDSKFLVVRYNADGTLDTSFGGGDGKVTTNFTPGGDAAYGVAIDVDGKIVVAGDTGVQTGNARFGVARYDTDGTLDTTFSGDGKVMTQFTPKDDLVVALAIQGDGKILVAGGAAFNSSNPKLAIVRYETDGSLDTTFSGDGKVTTDASPHRDYANSVAIQGDGKIVAGGLAVPGRHARMLVVRYASDGTPDTSFSGDGKVITAFTSHDDSAQSVLVDGSGNLVAAGIAGSGGSNAKFAIARFTSTGTLDTTFSGDGKVTTDFTSHYDAAWDAALDSNGEIVLAGEASGSGGRFAVARYDTDGSLDTTFSGDGKVLTNFTAKLDFALGVAIQTDDNIVAVGGSGWGMSNPKVAAARYLGT